MDVKGILNPTMKRGTIYSYLNQKMEKKIVIIIDKGKIVNVNTHEYNIMK